jgi:hypothetical protein
MTLLSAGKMGNPSKTLRETALRLSGWQSRQLFGVDLSLRREATVKDFMHHEERVTAGEREPELFPPSRPAAPLAGRKPMVDALFNLSSRCLEDTPDLSRELKEGDDSDPEDSVKTWRKIHRPRMCEGSRRHPLIPYAKVQRAEARSGASRQHQ